MRRAAQLGGVWEAIAARRRREVPAGTVGGRIACAKTPRSSARLAEAHRVALVAHDQWHDVHVARRAPAKPSRGERAAQCAGGGVQTLHAVRTLLDSSSSAASAPATAGGQGAVEKISERAVLTR